MLIIVNDGYIFTYTLPYTAIAGIRKALIGLNDLALAKQPFR